MAGLLQIHGKLSHAQLLPKQNELLTNTLRSYLSLQHKQVHKLVHPIFQMESEPVSISPWQGKPTVKFVGDRAKDLKDRECLALLLLPNR